MHRLTFIAGLAIGYVLGTRSGRERYEQMRESAQQFAQNPAVRNAAESAAHNGRDMATKAFDSVNEKVGHRLPDSVTEKVQALRDRRTPVDDDWGTSAT
ncbi:YtxH domain-containing protein [Streptomyces armeniacus]|uniref:YtxH domain-containing protein n=1 Tax=Streptomyces armeniacus TaxID=83291 RepID=A0A345XXR7_9ACTN|nr:YtxH domain-containing protein [Streptomyces armeniacus]AXK36433.1 YtxH domain-containing protein [Streptomyces armeniacus]